MDAREPPPPDRHWLEALLARLPVGVIFVDRESGQVLLLNEEASRLLGAPSERLDDTRALDELLRRGARGNAASGSPLARTLASGESIRDEVVEIAGADGETRCVGVTTTAVRAAGGVAGVAVVLTDVTADDQRERASRDFVTNAAHELQTPIAAITSAIEVLEAGAKDEPAERDRFLHHIDAAVDRLARLTRALLVLARAQAGHEAPRSEVVELAPLVARVAADRPDRAVAVDCDPELAALTNEALLTQVVANLVDNAIKHGRTGVAVRCSRDGTGVRLDVVDGGPGIPAAARAAVFDRFRRFGDGDGFGLGLSIAREAVAALGAELDLDSGPGGTRVSILLPGARLRRR